MGVQETIINTFGYVGTFLILAILALIIYDNFYNNNNIWKFTFNNLCGLKSNQPTVPVLPPVVPPVQPAVQKASPFSNNNEPEVFNNTEEFNNTEGFNNDLPKENVVLKEDEDDYSQTIQEMALDKSVLDQHNTYVNERNKVTSTASFQPSRSDAQDVVPFRGLRRPQYSAGGKDLVDETARTVPSELDSDQLAKPTQIYWK